MGIYISPLQKITGFEVQADIVWIGDMQNPANPWSVVRAFNLKGEQIGFLANGLLAIMQGAFLAADDKRIFIAGNPQNKSYIEVHTLAGGVTLFADLDSATGSPLQEIFSCALHGGELYANVFLFGSAINLFKYDAVTAAREDLTIPLTGPSAARHLTANTTRLAIVDGNNGVSSVPKIYDRASLQLLATLTDTYPKDSVTALNEDSLFVLRWGSLGNESEIEEYTLDGTFIRVLAVVPNLSGPDGPAVHLAATNQFVAVALNGYAAGIPSRVHIYSAETGDLIKEIEGAAGSNFYYVALGAPGSSVV